MKERTREDQAARLLGRFVKFYEGMLETRNAVQSLACDDDDEVFHAALEAERVAEQRFYRLRGTLFTALVNSSEDLT